MFKRKKGEIKKDNNFNNPSFDEMRSFYDNNSRNYGTSDYDEYYSNQNDKKSSYYDNDDYFAKSEVILSKKKKQSNDKSNKMESLFSKIIILIVILIVIVIVILVVTNITKSYNIVFDLNGATEIYEAPTECNGNILGKCYVTLPKASKKNGEVLGYGTKKSDTIATYKVGDKIELTEDTTLYVISKSQKKLIIDSSSIDDFEKIDLSCDAYNTEKSCEVTVPKYNKRGYLNKGYSQKNDGSEITLYPGEKYQLEENKEYYPIYDKYQLRQTFNVSNISKSVELKKVYVDVTNSCPNAISDKAITSIKKIEEKYPFLFANNKITLLSRLEFGKYTYYGSAVKGLTFGNQYNSVSVFIACEENEMDIYSVIVHELMHVYDAKAKYLFGKNFSDSSDVLAAYNKYKRSYSSVMRSYSFDSQYEFFAELLTYYYFNYVDTTHKFVGLVDYRETLPNDLKLLAEKYLCLGANNYDEKMCK